MFIPPPEKMVASIPTTPQPSVNPEQDLVNFIVDGINHGSKPSDICRHLVALGMQDTEAANLVQQVVHSMAGHAPLSGPAVCPPAPMHTLGLSKFSKRARQKNTEAQPELSLAAEDEMLKNIGARNMLFGGFFFLAGLILTIITFAAASSSGGGRFILAWGAIFWGGAQFFRGLIQTSRANR